MANELMELLSIVENNIPFCFYSDQKIYEHGARNGFREVSAKGVSESGKNEFPFANSEKEGIPLVNSFNTLVFERGKGSKEYKMRERCLDIDKDRGIIKIKNKYIDLWREHEQEIRKVAKNTVNFSRLVFDDFFANVNKNNLELKIGSLYRSQDMEFILMNRRTEGRILQNGEYLEETQKIIKFSVTKEVGSRFINKIESPSMINGCTPENWVKKPKYYIKRFTDVGSVHVFVKQDYHIQTKHLYMYLGKGKIGDNHVDEKSGMLMFKLHLEKPLDDEIFKFLSGITHHKSK